MNLVVPQERMPDSMSPFVLMCDTLRSWRLSFLFGRQKDIKALNGPNNRISGNNVNTYNWDVAAHAPSGVKLPSAMPSTSTTTGTGKAT
jgi:hypothetical protein